MDLDLVLELKKKEEEEEEVVVQNIRIKSKEVYVDESYLRESVADIEHAYQYFEMYKYRLQTLRPYLLENIRSLWGNVTIESRVLGAHNNMDNIQNIVITGTLYKEMSEKPSPLKNFSEAQTTFGAKHDKAYHGSVVDAQVVDDDDDVCYVRENDYLTIEDEIGSLKIEGECLEVAKLYSGIVIALKGFLQSHNGIFYVKEYLLLGLPIQKPIPTIKRNDRQYVAIVSGLNMGKQDCNRGLIEMLGDYLSGYTNINSLEFNENNDDDNNNNKENIMMNGNDNNDEEDGLEIHRISALIIAGDALAEDFPTITGGGDTFEEEYSLEAKQKREQKADALTNSLKELDIWLSVLCSNLDVYLMPGKKDPSTLLLPQQPLHKCLFPYSNTFNTFHCVSNPSQIEIDGISFLGTSGQNVSDMQKYGKCDSIECLELTLKSRNIAPTACDTLQCFPYRNNDPFIIKECPHVYFAGNCKDTNINVKTLKGSDWQKVTLVSLPSFEKTGQLVLIDTVSLDCEIVEFAINK